MRGKELTTDTTVKAVVRAKQEHPRVSRISAEEIAVSCKNSAHPGGHVVRYRRTPSGRLFAECYLRETGEACPSETGKGLCYHALAGVTLFLLMEWRRENWVPPTRPRAVRDRIEAILSGASKRAPALGLIGVNVGSRPRLA